MRIPCVLCMRLAQNRTNVRIEITVKYDYSIQSLLIMHVAEVSSILHQKMNGTKSFEWTSKCTTGRDMNLGHFDLRTGYEHFDLKGE